MTFGCRPPVSHGPAAYAAPAAGRQPRLRSACQPPLLVYTWTLRKVLLGEKIYSWQLTRSGPPPLGHFSKVYLSSVSENKLQHTEAVVALKFQLLSALTFAACRGSLLLPFMLKYFICHAVIQRYLKFSVDHFSVLCSFQNRQSERIMWSRRRGG